jgi:hypothetical protein
MKKVVVASLMALAAAASFAVPTYAQQQPAAAAGSGSVQMSPDEYAAYNNANTQTTPLAKAQAFEAYLKAYPKSAVKEDVLNQLVYLYGQLNNKEQTLDAADRLLAIAPNNLQALTYEVYFRRADADMQTDPAAKQAALDKVVMYAQTGLAAPKPAGATDAQKAAADQTFESAIADDDVAKKDFDGAAKELKTEIDGNADATKAPGPVLQDMYILANTYYKETPPDYLDCAWYATRAAAFAGQFAAQIQPLATFCYTRYHGNKDGYAVMQTAAQAGTVDTPAVCPLAPPGGTAPAPTPGCLAVTPAPKPEDIVANLIATTPDLATLAISDKEFVLQYGKAADADKVFDTIKGKSVELPGVVVVSATATVLTVSVSDDAVQSKTADFTFTMKEPIKDADIPAVGAKVSLDGTYASYTQKPLMINMTDGALVLPKKPVVHHAPVHHR